ncbi:MAG: TonB-dependent receptor [Steroidobacteraceae bacterium]
MGSILVRRAQCGNRWLPVAAGACLLGVSSAQAAETDQANATAPVTLQEVVVTGERQAAVDIQSAPLAISVVNTDNLARAGGQGFNDYLEGLPSLFLQQSSPGQNEIVIRGMSIMPFNHTTLSDRSLVSVYLDDTPVALQGNTPDFKLFDLERVEVIRGPQGTLFGSSAMAGNIRYITKKPQPGRFDALAEATLSDTKDGSANYSVRGMVNLPLADTLALRINGYRGDNSGYIDNIGINKKNANGDYATQARVALRWQAADALTVDVSHLYYRLRSNGDPTQFQFVTTPLRPFDTYDTNIPEHYNDNTNISNLTISYLFGPAELISSSSYIHRDFDRITSGQYLVGRPGLGLGDVPYDDIMSVNDINNTLRSFTQEVRLQSYGDNRLTWITGVYYENTRRTQVQDIPTVGYDQQAFGGFLTGFGLTSSDIGTPHDDDPFYGDTRIDETQVAVFADTTFAFTPKLHGTVGARYFNYRQHFDLYFAGILGIDFDTFEPLTVNQRPKDNGTTPRARLAYQATDDLLLFAEAAQGFRLGGVNQPIPQSCGEPGPLTFGPDKVWTYQIGEKSAWLDKRLLLNLTAYLNNWDDVQTQRVLADCSYAFTSNGGKIRGTGVEFESQLSVTDHLTWGVSASYNRTVANGDIRFPSQLPGAPDDIIALDGQRAPGTPRYEGSTNADYTVPLFSGASLDLHADFRYREGYYTGWFDKSVQPAPAYDPADKQLNLAVNYLSGSAWETGVFVRNVTNDQELYQVQTIKRDPPVTQNIHSREISRPRTIGVRFLYHF